ncbi:MAG: endonuclease III [Clostridia bacterium]
MNNDIKNAMVIKELEKLFPEPKCELDFSNAFELLIAVILSAQCTDKRVNMVTPVLFEKFGNPKLMSDASQKELEQIIHSCGFYVNKAKNIIACSKKICEDFGGEVPNTLEDLCSLDGVGRKTANVVLSIAFNIPAIAVDTHVFRVTARLGIAKGKDAFETEQILRNEFKKEDWVKLHFSLVLFGRRICDAKKPKCNICPLYDICEYVNKGEKNVCR